MNVRNLSLTVPYVFQTKEEHTVKNARLFFNPTGVFKKCLLNKKEHTMPKENKDSN